MLFTISMVFCLAWTPLHLIGILLDQLNLFGDNIELAYLTYVACHLVCIKKQNYLTNSSVVECNVNYGNTGCGGFFRVYKIFAEESTYSKEIIGSMGRCRKVPKFDFKSQFSTSKFFRIFLIVLSLKNINSEAHILLLTFFDIINF